MKDDFISGPEYDYIKVINGEVIGVYVDTELGNDEEVLNINTLSEEIDLAERYLDNIRSLRISMKEKEDEQTNGNSV